MKYQVKQNGLWDDRAISVQSVPQTIEEFERLWAEAVDRYLQNMSEQQMVEYLDTL